MLLPLEHTLQKLKAYNNVSYPILSVYIDTFHKDQPDMLRDFRHLIVDYLTEEEQDSVKRSISYIQSFLKSFPTPQTCRTLALFAGGDHLWEVVTTELAIPSYIAVNHSPFITPIERRLAEKNTYLVVLADREKALLVSFTEGTPDGKKEVYAESEDQKVPQKVKGRNATMRTGKIEQHIHEHLRKHLKHIGAEVDSFLEEQPIAGVLIGSHQQLIKPLEDHLPNKLKGKILGEFIADLNAPFHKIIEKSQQELLSHHLFQPHPSLMLAK